MPFVVDVILMVCAGMLVLAGILALIRLSLGPTALDRAVAVDVITAVVVGLTAVTIVWWDRSDLMPLLIIFALTGFFSAVTIARFSEREERGGKRILTKEESLKQKRQREDEEARELRQESLRVADVDNDDEKEDEL